MNNKSWKVEVSVNGSWSANQCRFATKEEADGSGQELLSRWFVPDEARSVESSDPVNYRFDKETFKNVRLEA